MDTKGNAVDLLFFTDESGDSRGWRLHYTTESKSFRVECGVLLKLVSSTYETLGSIFSTPPHLKKRKRKNLKCLSTFLACQY